MEKYLKIPDGTKYVCGTLNTEHFGGENFGHYSKSSIYYGEMHGNSEIEWVYMPDSVVIIGFKAFENCSNLKTVYFSKGLKRIQMNAFLGCQCILSGKYT